VVVHITVNAGHLLRTTSAQRKGSSGMATAARTVTEEIVPDLAALEAAAGREQRRAHALQATYLLVLLLAPVVPLLPLRVANRDAVDDRVAAALLLVAVVLRLVMRAVAAESDWVQARRATEEARAGAWRRAAMAAVAPGDGPRVHEIAAQDVGERWRQYRTHRVDDQIGYFTRRARDHARAARRWRVVRVVLTAATLTAAALALVRPALVAPGTTGLLSAVLATTEA
jgi:hypothetical protein